METIKDLPKTYRLEVIRTMPAKEVGEIIARIQETIAVIAGPENMEMVKRNTKRAGIMQRRGDMVEYGALMQQVANIMNEASAKLPIHMRRTMNEINALYKERQARQALMKQNLRN